MADFIARILFVLFAPIGLLCRMFKHPFRTEWKERSEGLYDHCVVCGVLIKKEKNT